MRGEIRKQAEISISNWRNKNCKEVVTTRICVGVLYVFFNALVVD